MQLTGGLVLCGLAALASANPQGGFFGGLGGLFNRFQGRPQGGGGGGGGCRPSGPNHNFGGRNYLVSWRLGCTQFSQGEAAAYCRSNGMSPISLDSPAKEQEFTNLVAREGQPYFWTGGTVNTAARTVSWPSGQTTSTSLWSHTGGAGRPQPDNREGNERCLGVLNNFYQDGVKFHDISCHHRKPVICEA